MYAVDINGHKGPNKWGYDIFSFSLLGNSKNGISNWQSNSIIEDGGQSFEEMYNEAFNIK